MAKWVQVQPLSLSRRGNKTKIQKIQLKKKIKAGFSPSPDLIRAVGGPVVSTSDRGYAVTGPVVSGLAENIWDWRAAPKILTF